MELPTGDALQEKSKIGWVALGGIGCAGIALLVFCCVLILVFIRREPNARVDTIGTLVVDANGGIFQSEDIRIRVSAGAVQQPISLTISRDPSVPDELKDFGRSSAAYQISGPIAQINGNIEILLYLSDDDLAGEGGGLVLEESTYAPSYGEVIHILPLPTNIDDANQTATSLMWLGGQEAVGGMPAVPAAGIYAVLPNALLLQRSDENDLMRVRFVPGIFYNAYESEHFTLNYLGKLHDANTARQAVDLLEEQYQKIIGKGFEFKGIDRIQVTVKYLDNRTGQFVSSMRGARYTSLELSSEFFKDANKFNQNQTELKATIGHELIHMAQFSMDPRYAYFKAKSPGPLLWLDEAIATWFESIAVDDPNYVPQNASRMSNFVNQPLLMPPSDYDLAQDHGYGASLFIKYLAGQYSSYFPAEIYREVADGASTGSQALILALQRHMTDLDSEWPSFLQAYYADPAAFGKQFNPPSINFVALKAVEQTDQGEYAITFTPSRGLISNQSSTAEGSLFEGTPASIEFNFERAPLSAEAFYVMLNTSDSSPGAFQTPATLIISVEAPGDSGLLVLGQMGNGAPFVPLAGAPFGYLSSGDALGESGNQLMVEGFDLSGSEMHFDRLLLIPFNHHNDFSGAGHSTRIRVQLTYWTFFEMLPPDSGLDEWPTEVPAVPTEPPSQPESSHACAGVSVADMRNRKLNSLRCWITCFGEGANPSEAEIQSCIDRNQ
jgi:hypothetical protein